MLSRIFRGENENAAVKRKRQIDTLKIFNDNVLELQEDVEYQVLFNAGDRCMAIMVSLSPDFPLEKPVLRVSPPIKHKWCNEHSEITSAPGLLNFTIHSDLGRVVQAIIREFSKNPPQLQEDNSPLSDLAGRASPSYSWNSHELATASFNPYPPYSPPAFQQFSSTNTTQSIYNYNFTNASNAYDPQSSAKQQQQQQPQYVPPVSYMGNSVPNEYSTSPSTANAAYTNLHYVNANVMPSQVQYKTSSKIHCLDFPELENMSNEELIKLGKDEDLMDEFLEKNTKLKELDSAVVDAIDWVEKTANMNLCKQQELDDLREDVGEKVKTVKSLKVRYDKLIERYNKLSEIYAPEHIRDCLAKAADESQEQSEQIAQDFLDRKIDVERFLSTYVECRKLGQARRTKEEKLAHQLNELKRTGH